METQNQEHIEEQIEENNNENVTSAGKQKFDIFNLIIYLVGCYLIALILTNYVFAMVTVEGESMYPTLNSVSSNKCSDKYCVTHDIAFTDLLTFKLFGINRFDIVIVKGEAINEHRDVVKRVIGLPNETIRYQDGVLYINDVVVEEKFILDEIKLKTDKIEEVTLKDNEYYVLGDNRAISKDSRDFGPIEKDDILGRGLLKYLTLIKSNNSVIDYRIYFPFVVK